MAPGVNVEILVRPLGGGGLIRDYLAGDDALAPFFAGRPFVRVPRVPMRRA